MANEEPQWQSEAQRILIVDDEEDILESLKDLIEATLERVEVVTFPAAREALKILEEGRVDLVISDYKMPDMDGLEFLRKAYGLRPNVPRIMITAFPDLEVAVSAINDARIENFFTKPMDPAQVIEVISQALAGQQEKVHREQAFARSLDVLRSKQGSED